MVSMRRSLLALPLGVVLLAGCSAAKPAWLGQEEDACFRTRDFTEEIPRAYWGNPARDPCWRFRRVLFPDD
jgi:hypothetical protein